MLKLLNRLFSILLLTSLTACTNVFLQPSNKLLITPDQLNIPYSDITFTSKDKLKLNGWWFPAQQNSKALVIFLHGNAENISTHSAGVHWLTKHQFDVFIFDYRGYGRSEGQADIDMSINDIYSAIDYAVSHYPAEKKIFLIGQSLGASMGIYALAQRPDDIDAAVFVSPFSDYRKISREMLATSWISWAFQWPLSFMVSNDYRPLDYASALPDIPILYLYSHQDEVIKPEHVQTLYQHTHQPKFIEQLDDSHSRILSNENNRNVLLKYLNTWLD